LDDYVTLTPSQKQQIAFDVSINFATQLARWDYQFCVQQTRGELYCNFAYSHRTLGEITNEFRPIGNYDTDVYDLYTEAKYYGLQPANLTDATFVSSVVNSLLMGCLGNFTCQTEYAKRPDTYARVATDIVQTNIAQVVAQLSTNLTWIPDGSYAKYLRRFAIWPDYQAEIFGIHNAIPLAMLAGYLNNTAFGSLLQMQRIMVGAPLRMENSINTIALLGLQVPDWSNVNNSILSNIYGPDAFALNKRAEVDWFNVDPMSLLKQMKPSKAMEKRGVDTAQIKAACAEIGLATSIMSIRGIANVLTTKIRPRPTIATFNNAFGAYDSSENLLLGTVTGLCAKPGSTCYGSPSFWQYAGVAGDAVDIIAGYIGFAAAATASVPLAEGAAAIGIAAEFGLNTINLVCAVANFAMDVGQAITEDCQRDPSLPECAALAAGCLNSGSINHLFGVVEDPFL